MLSAAESNDHKCVQQILAWGFNSKHSSDFLAMFKSVLVPLFESTAASGTEGPCKK